MLKKLLSREECANCKICCSFDDYDIWETPIIDEELKVKVLKLNPEQKFVAKGNSSILRMEKDAEEDLYFCSVLDRQKGCLLGDEKPFDCRIWPFRVMRLDKRLVITLSPVCPVVQTRPLSLIKEVCDELAPIIYAQAQKNPDIVKNYIENFPIINVKED